MPTLNLDFFPAVADAPVHATSLLNRTCLANDTETTKAFPRFMMVAARSDRLKAEAAARLCSVDCAQRVGAHVFDYSAGTSASPVGFTTGMISASEDGETTKTLIGEILGHNEVGLADM